MTCRLALLPLLASACYVSTPGLALPVTRALDVERLEATDHGLRVFVRPDAPPWTLSDARLATPTVTLTPCDPTDDTASAVVSLLLPTAWAHEPIASDDSLPAVWDLTGSGPFQHTHDMPVPPGQWCGVTLSLSGFPTLALEGHTGDAPFAFRREAGWSTARALHPPLTTGRNAPAAALSIRILVANWLADLSPDTSDPLDMLPSHLEVSVAVSASP